MFRHEAGNVKRRLDTRARRGSAAAAAIGGLSACRTCAIERRLDMTRRRHHRWRTSDASSRVGTFTCEPACDRQNRCLDAERDGSGCSGGMPLPDAVFLQTHRGRSPVIEGDAEGPPRISGETATISAQDHLVVEIDAAADGRCAAGDETARGEVGQVRPARLRGLDSDAATRRATGVGTRSASRIQRTASTETCRTTSASLPPQCGGMPSFRAVRRRTRIADRDRGVGIIPVSGEIGVDDVRRDVQR